MNKVGRPLGTFKGVHPTRVNGKVTKAYTCYQAMLSRCYNPKSHNYNSYGGRGIHVCDRWRADNGYDNFVSDLGVPLPGYTLERIDNSSHYSPENCRWATWKEQAQNRRPKRCSPTSLWGKASLVGIPYHVVYQRVKLLGWDEQRALTTPVNKPGRVTGWRKAL